MRRTVYLTLVAFLTACAPAPALAPAADGSQPMLPAAPGAAAAIAPAASTAPQASPDTGVVLTGVVMAPASLQAPGAPRALSATRSLSAAGEQPLANAPVRLLDPITRRVLGEGITDAQGRYRLALGVTVAPDKTLMVSVSAVGPGGEAVELATLTRPGNKPRDGGTLDTPVGLATSLLVMHMIGTGGVQSVDGLVVADFMRAVARLEEAMDSTAFDVADLSDPAAVADALGDFAEGDTTLGELVDTLASGDAGGTPAGTTPDTTTTTTTTGGGSGGGGSGGGGSGGGGSGGGGDPTPAPSATPRPIFSGSIR